MVDDFDDGSPPNLLGGCALSFTDSLGVGAINLAYDNAAEHALRVSGFVLDIKFDVSGPGAPFSGYVQGLTNNCPPTPGDTAFSVGDLDQLTFWTRRNLGNVDVEVAVGDADGVQTDPKLLVNRYLMPSPSSDAAPSCGVTFSWRKAVIPIIDLIATSGSRAVDLTRLTELSFAFAKERFNLVGAADTGTIQIDEIAFERAQTVASDPLRLVVTASPERGTALNPITPPLEVSAQDEMGSVTASFSDSVFVSLTPGTGTPGARLEGTTVAAAVDGMAVFDSLVVTRVGSGYTFDITSNSLTAATTEPFDISWMVWTPELKATTGNFQEVWGQSETDVFAAGDAGMFHLDSGSWVEHFTGVADGFRALAGDSTATGTREIFAGAGCNLCPAPLVVYNGTSWAPAAGWMPINGSAVRSAWIGPSTVVLGGNGGPGSHGGLVWHRESGTWTEKYDGPDSTSVLGLWGAADDDVFGVGMNETILRFDGVAWQSDPQWTPTADSALNSVWGSAPDNVWVVGHNGTLLYFNGVSWTELISGVSESLNEIWGTAKNDIFIAGDNGLILHFDGNRWTPEPTGTTVPLGGIWVSPTGKLGFAVGWDGLILRGVR